jgi:hypothetical protein
MSILVLYNIIHSYGVGSLCVLVGFERLICNQTIYSITFT